MGHVNFRTLFDYSRHCSAVAIVCRRCRHTKSVEVRELVGWFGLPCRKADAEKRLKCSACGRRGGRLVPLP